MDADDDEGGGTSIQSGDDAAMESTEPSVGEGRGAGDVNASSDNVVTTNATSANENVNVLEQEQEQGQGQEQTVNVQVTARPESERPSRVLVVVKERDSGRILEQQVINVHGNITSTNLEVVTKGKDNVVVATQNLEGDADVSVAADGSLLARDEASGLLVSGGDEVQATQTSTEVEDSQNVTAGTTSDNVFVEDAKDTEVETGDDVVASTGNATMAETEVEDASRVGAEADARQTGAAARP